MHILRADNASDAVRYALQCRDEGEFDFFRGQTQCWPLLPSLLRLAPAARQDAAQRMRQFLHWVDTTRAASAMLPGLEHRVAVAQHYGLPTALLDVTREPRVAGFFATHDAAVPASAMEVPEGCLFCFHSGRFAQAMDTLRAKAVADGFDEERVDLPYLLDIDVGNLWRLQAQQGAFLVVPWDSDDPGERLLERLLDATCIVFPVTGALRQIGTQRVYPDRKSALEVLLDEFFAREGLAQYQAERRAAGVTIIDGGAIEAFAARTDQDSPGFRPEVVRLQRLLQEGRGAEIFRGGEVPLPHESWLDPARLDRWQKPRAESFDDAVTAQACLLRVEDADDRDALEEACVASVRAALAAGQAPRQKSVHWRIVDAAGADVPAPTDDGEWPDADRPTAGDWVELAWDGMRALPYSDEELAIAIGRIAAGLTWAARGQSLWDAQGQMAIELLTDAGGDPMVSIPEDLVLGALRRDLWLLLAPEWHCLLEEPRLLLDAVANPALLFDLEVWLRAFAAYLVPSQVLRCAQAGTTWVVYNPLLTRGLRKH